MKDKRKAYEEKLDGQLKEWNAQIALLKAKAENAKASSGFGEGAFSLLATDALDPDLQAQTDVIGHNAINIRLSLP
jgi:hypothetical protein